MYLVRLCMDMQTGHLRHMPQAGAVIDQSPLILDCMRICWYTWFINEHKPAHNIPITLADTEFMRDLLPPDYKPKSAYNRDAVKRLKEDVKHG